MIRYKNIPHRGTGHEPVPEPTLYLRNLLPKSAHARNATIISTVVVLATANSIGSATKIYADQYDDRISALQVQVQQYQAQATSLRKQASSLSAALAIIMQEKAAIQTQIDIAQVKYDQLQKQIEATQSKIKSNRDALGLILANIYTDDSITPLEMLASSKNISSYLDKQQYRESIRSQLTTTIESVKALQAQLAQQQTDFGRTLTDGKNAHQQLAGKEAAQQALLVQTNGQEATYQQLSAARQSEADKLVQEQIAYNVNAAKRSGSQTLVSDTAHGGGYPTTWANSPQDTIADSWGLYNRECVSYVAWKIASTGRFVPNFNGQGNANQWQSYVAQYGIRSGTTPVVGSAAVLYGGAYGHVMYVEAVSSDKSRITISEYNYGWSGMYSKRSISSSDLTYLYF